MSILSRYITVTWLRLLALTLGSFMVVHLVLDMMDRFPRFLRAGGAVRDILRYYLYKLPEMLGATTPFSILMATLLTLGLLSRNSEIIAMRGSGVSLPRISLPMLVLGLLSSLLLLANAELVVPKSYERMDYVERIEIKKQGFNAVFKRNNIWFRSDSRILQAQMFDPQSKTLRGVVVWTLDSSMNPVSRIDAESADYRDGQWTLRKVELKKLNRDQVVEQQSVSTMDIPLNLKVDDLRVLDKHADNLSFLKLKEYADNLKSGGYNAFRYQTLMHNKISGPFAAFVMVVLGIPFALRSSRSGGMAMGIGTSIGIGFAYFVVNAVLLSYGRSGVLPPMVAAWGANILFVLSGIWLAMTVKN